MKNLIVILTTFLLISAGYNLTNAQVTQEWVQRYNGPSNLYDVASSIAIDDSGNVYVTGLSLVGSYGADYATIKYNSNGDLLWVRTYGTFITDDYATSLVVDDSGNVYVTGFSLGNGTGGDYATIKYNSNGDSLWVKRYNGPGNYYDRSTSLAVDGSGNVYVTGSAYDSLTSNDYATIKYNSSGVQQWVQRYNGPGNLNDAASSIAVDGSGNVYVTGSSDNSGNYPTDYATIKYSSVSSTLLLTALIEGFYNNSTNKMIRDTVKACLRNSTLPYAIVDSARTVLDSTGNGTFNFFNASNSTPYYIVIKHRNSIETWSSAGQSFTSNSLSYDFTTNSSQAYGNNMKQIDITPVSFAVYSGDVNRDGVVDLTDNQLIDNDAYNFVSGYVNTDLTGDNNVDLSDAAIAENNAFNFVNVIRP
ncbi:MAG: SBBP repeat-containing protein [Bacteroidota bacterium]|nr:SBBP repeat-containing protein [Bacteroidota bacterium]